MSTNENKIKAGDIGFGRVNEYGPCRWRLHGKRAGVWVLSQVKPQNQTTAFPDQYVDWETVERIMAS